MMFMKCHRSKLSVWAALCILVLCWLYIFPAYRLPSDKDVVEEVLAQGKMWTKNQTGIDMYREFYIPPQADTDLAHKELQATVSKMENLHPEAAFIIAGDFNQASLRKSSGFCIVHLIYGALAKEAFISPYYPAQPGDVTFPLNIADGNVYLEANMTYKKLITECCDPRKMFALTKENSPIGKVLWYDGEFYHSRTVNNDTYPLFVKETPLKLPLKRCSVVGNGGILRRSGCGSDIDQADFVMRSNLPPLYNEYTEDVGTKTHLVTANPSIIEKRFQNLLWSRKVFVESMKAYDSSYVYMSAFTMKLGTEPSLRAYHALADTSSNQTVLFANPDFLKSVGKFWKSRGVHAKRLSTGLFLISLALGLCDEVMAYGFWPFSVDLDQQPVSHHYYDNILPDSGFHAMPEEFLQLWNLHKMGTLRLHIGHCTETQK